MPEEMMTRISFLMRQAIDCGRQLRHSARTMEDLCASPLVEDSSVKQTDETRRLLEIGIRFSMEFMGNPQSYSEERLPRWYWYTRVLMEGPSK